MAVQPDLSALTRTKWYEYALRFLFGGVITVLTGILAKRYGPVFGGVFLAFPAIFPASATLIEKHEKEKKRKAGISDSLRGSLAAALDARGAAQGCVGLMCFAAVVWKMAPASNGALTLMLASVTWFFVSLLIWMIRKHLHAWLR